MWNNLSIFTILSHPKAPWPAPGTPRSFLIPWGLWPPHPQQNALAWIYPTTEYACANRSAEYKMYHDIYIYIYIHLTCVHTFSLCIVFHNVWLCAHIPRIGPFETVPPSIPDKTHVQQGPREGLFVGWVSSLGSCGSAVPQTTWKSGEQIIVYHHDICKLK